MGNLINSLNKLKTNIFGGAGNTGSATPILRKTGTELAATSPIEMAMNDPFAFSSISYPRDVTNNLQNGHYMLFYVNVQDKTKYRYQDPNSADGVIGGVERKSKVDSAGNMTMTEEKGDDKFGKYSRGTTAFSERIGSNLSKTKQGGIKGRGGITNVKGRSTTSRVTDSVAIYLPSGITDNVTAGYTDAQTGMVGLVMGGLLQAGGDFATADYAEAVSAGVKTVGAVLKEALKKSAAGIAEGLTETEGAAGLMNKVFGVADNPYMEVLFDKMEMRNFTYNFTFAPKNDDETADVQRIITLFRFHMAPELQGAQSRFLTLPSEFDIHYMYQAADGSVATDNDYYNKVGTCVLTNCAVDYTPNGVKSFNDGAPTQIKLSLTFRETELLTKERVNEGF